MLISVRTRYTLHRYSRIGRMILRKAAIHYRRWRGAALSGSRASHGAIIIVVCNFIAAKSAARDPRRCRISLLSNELSMFDCAVAAPSPRRFERSLWTRLCGNHRSEGREMYGFVHRSFVRHRNRWSRVWNLGEFIGRQLSGCQSAAALKRSYQKSCRTEISRG
jgi:hypothetical protein